MSKRPRHFGWVNGAITERHRCNCRGHGILLKFWEHDIVLKMNDHYNFNLKIQKLQTHLEMWSSRSLTLFRKVLIIKSYGLSQILYSVSNTNVPKDTITTVKRKLLVHLEQEKGQN